LPASLQSIHCLGTPKVVSVLVQVAPVRRVEYRLIVMGIPQGIDFQGVYQFGNHARFLQSGKSGQGAGSGESHVRMGVLKESRQIVSINGFAAWIDLNERSDQAGYLSTTPKIGLSHHVHQIRDQLDAGLKRGDQLSDQAGYVATTLWVCPQ